MSAAEVMLVAGVVSAVGVMSAAGVMLAVGIATTGFGGTPPILVQFNSQLDH